MHSNLAIIFYLDVSFKSSLGSLSISPHVFSVQQQSTQRKLILDLKFRVVFILYITAD